MNPHRKKKIYSVHTSLLVILSFPMSIRPLQPNLALPIAPMVRSLSKLFKDQTACSDNGVPCKVNASKPPLPFSNYSSTGYSSPLDGACPTITWLFAAG